MFFSGHESVVRVLLAAKANPEARNNYSHLRRQFFGGTVMPPLEGPKNDGNWEMVIPWKTKWPFWVYIYVKFLGCNKFAHNSMEVWFLIMLFFLCMGSFVRFQPFIFHGVA